MPRSGECRSVSLLLVQDPYVGIDLTVELDPPATVWRFPVETVSNSEEGFERTFQGSCFQFRWPAGPEGYQEFKMMWRWQKIS